MNCGFIIRCHYEEGDPRFAWRLAYFQTMVLPRLQAQTDKNFDICVRCNPVHDELFAKLGCIPFHVKHEYTAYMLSNGGTKKYFYDFVKWEDVIGLKQYDIQIGLDTDDLIRKDMVVHIKSLCAKSKTSLHICFQPEWFNLETLKQSRHPIRYTSTNGSMIFALYYPDKSEYHHCYEMSHRKLWTIASRSVVVPTGWCWMTVHGQNESTGRKFSAEELKGLVKSPNYKPKEAPKLEVLPNPINSNQRIVIMAAGGGERWGNYQNTPKQLIPVDGEPLIKRTIRQLKERGVTDIWMTVKQLKQYGELGVNEYIPKDNKIAIDRIYASRELSPAIYLYGDVFYSERAMDVILSDTHEFRFFGRAEPGQLKPNREMYAIKANDWIIQKAGELRGMHLGHQIRYSLGKTLHYLCEGEKLNGTTKNFPVSRLVFGNGEWKTRWQYFTNINDETDDFDTPDQYRKFIQQRQKVVKPVAKLQRWSGFERK